MNRQIKHNDILGKNIEVNDVVAFTHSGQMKIGRILKLSNKMVRVKEYANPRWASEYLKYPFDTIKINESDAMFYILKNT